ncbi:MarR family transcriptional regulator [Corallococcus sp. AB011P]|uniref:MarR family winged helix-turn-helix transcriptional regulator n=1 Tax=Corallococcus sp. AB011P TaxID=2316735 RepID=UPI000EA280DA|nr:MarR family transcriptional regulator [Corallococcus sp. AB011P]RKG60732.1 MarR family transcriptional regulator [Corallococcus sp. AB011P]
MKLVPRYERLKQMAQRFPALDPSAIETCLTMLRLSNELTEAYEAHFARHGVSHGRFVVLVQLFAAEDAGETLRPADLAELSSCSRATITGLLDTLEKDGFISRMDHPEDRRMYSVHLTSKGREFIQGMMPDHYRRIAALMAPLSLDERDTLRALLAKVSSGIPALRDP